MATEIKKDIVYGNFRQPHKKRKAQKKMRPGDCPIHRENIRKLPCIVCGINPGGQIHHLKCAGGRGMGMRAPDKCGVPMCEDDHINGVERVGSKQENKWFRDQGIDVLEFANALWSNRHDFNAMMDVWAVYWERKSPQIETDCET